MGMSGDYKLAIAEGSTMVRIGSLLFADTVWLIFGTTFVEKWL
jgi:hypothetical protein